MADENAARRRELRRRKILECSEARLLKITSSNRKYKPEAAKSVETTQSSINIQEKTANTLSSNYAENDSHESMLPDERLCNSEVSSKFKNIEENYTNSVNGSIRRSSSSDLYSFPKKVSDAEMRSFGRNRTDIRRSSMCSQMIQESWRFSSFSFICSRPYIMIILAALVTIYFRHSKNSAIFQSIFLPYAILELTLCFWKNVEFQVSTRSVASSLIPGFLILCGCRPSVVTAFNSIWNTIKCITLDVAIYLFSFVMLHYIFETYILINQ
ncbi:uncharacterized protein LOC129217541 [Uloborus diversus]|uniref:uncharacterized protein LOC129217541 n=1 Tax=Uloborus diversus TaxID=327109 RepID=UPI00240A41BB|nr:uncharacterized protein LOC129217541 [Uloborus diversus]